MGEVVVVYKMEFFFLLFFVLMEEYFLSIYNYCINKYIGKYKVGESFEIWVRGMVITV